MRKSCGRGYYPSWASPTRGRRSRSPASRNSAAPSARRGVPVRHSRVFCRRSGRYASMSASPGMARATMEAMFRIDVRPILPTISAPTLVIHARGDFVPVQGGRYLADHIPGGRLLEVDGRDHVPWLTNPDAVTSGIEEFLTGSHAAPPQSHRALHRVVHRHGRLDATRRGARRRAVARSAAPLRWNHNPTDRTIRRHGGQEHR